MNTVKTQGILDYAAISASVLCMLHCLATPLVLVAAPVLSATFLADEAFHRTIVLLVVPTSFMALYVGSRRHGDRSVLFGGMIGLVSLVLVAYFGHDLLGEAGEKAATVASGAALALAHLRNYRLCRRVNSDT